MKKKSTGRQFLALFLVLVMALSLCLPSRAMAAVKKPTAITLNNCGTGALTLMQGKSYSLSTTVTPSNATNKSLSYSTSNKKVATVSSKGKIKAVKTGSATITVKAKGNKKVYKKIKLKVVKKSSFKTIKSIKLKGATLYAGEKAKVKTTISPSSASNKNLTWKSSDKSVATVNNKGTVTAKAPGEVTITARANDGSKKKATVTILVKDQITVTIVNKMGEDTVQYLKTPGTVKRPADPTCEYADFEGWYTSSAYTEEFDFTKTITEDTEIVAKWTYKDADGDSIVDAVAEYYHLDDGEGAAEGDYDGDGLTDEQELNTFLTNPTLADSDENGVNDGDEDYDEDGLTNLQEYALGTDPTKSDTDADTLMDGAEAEYYSTDPLKADTDGDGLEDGDEITLGLDPLQAKSDGITPDSERTFEAEISGDALDATLLDEENLMIPCLKTDCAKGIFEDHVAVDAADEDEVPEDRYRVGSAVKVSTDYVDLRAELEFTFSQDEISEEECDDLTIIRLEDDEYIPMDTVMDYENGSLSANITEAGTYFVLNLEEFLRSVGLSDEKLLGITLSPEVPDAAEAFDMNASMTADLAAGEIRYYTVTPDADGTYSFSLDGAGESMQFLLYDAEGNIFGRSTSAAVSVSASLEENTTYYIAVAYHYCYQEGTFTLSCDSEDLDDDGIPMHPRTLSLGTSTEIELSAAINTAGRRVYYKFVPENSGEYYFTANTDTDTLGWLLDSEGNSITSDDDSGVDSNFYINEYLTAGETYYFGAGFYSSEATGSIPLIFGHVVKELWAPDSYRDLTGKTDVSITAALNSGDRAYYAYTPAEDGTCVITSSGEDDTYIEMFDMYGEQISYDDDDGEDGNFSLEQELAAGETYYFAVRFFDTNLQGDLTFSFTFAGKASSSADEGVAVFASGDGSGTDGFEEDHFQNVKKTSTHNTVIRRGRTESAAQLTAEEEVLLQTMASESGQYAGQADIVFAIDTTGSMSEEIYNVAQNVNLFVTALVNEYNVEANFALIDFKDIEEDGEDSTVVVKNGSSNWFSDVDTYKDKINDLYVSGGGDVPESDIDALETARRLDFRSGAAKFVILITDASCKAANRYGLTSMSEEISLMESSGITVSVIGDSYYESEYQSLYSSTGGIWANIYGDFSEQLLALADNIGEKTSDGTWVLLRGYKYVKLKGDPSEGYDTDGDGITDAKELGTLKTVSLTLLAKCRLHQMGVSLEELSTMTTVEYYDYISDPTLVDTDYDGIDDQKDPKPDNHSFTLTYFNHYGDDRVVGTNHVTMDYRWFFKSNTSYNASLGELSLIYAGAIYSDVSVGGRLDEMGSGCAAGMKAADLMKAYGMSNVITLKLNEAHSYYNSMAYYDQHISEVTFGHRKVTCNGQTKEIIQVVVRGTNGTLKEWESNFDVGDTDSFSKVSDWTHKNNHMGFDVASTRILKLLKLYIKRYVDSSLPQVYWITGHSRGAAIANILGADLVDEGKTVYDYTYATPNTTTSTNAGSYQGIYNLVNEDDFVPYLPMWEFRHYGKTACIDMTSQYEKEWEKYTGIGDYNPDTFGLMDTIDNLEALSSDRNHLYETSSALEHQEKLKKTTIDSALAELKRFKKSLPVNFDRSGKIDTIYYGLTLRWTYYGLFKDTTYYGYVLDETPAYFMQCLAGVMSGDIDGIGMILWNNQKLASGFNSVRLKLASSYIGGIEHPHYTETYHILSQHVSAGDFVAE